VVYPPIMSTDLDDLICKEMEEAGEGSSAPSSHPRTPVLVQTGRGRGEASHGLSTQAHAANPPLSRGT
jgi:hypothetical protein